MNERNSFRFDESTRDSNQSVIPLQINRAEHSSIISAIARCDRNEWLNLPIVVILRNETISPVDELRKHIANHDHIKPFSPLPDRVPPVLGNYDPSRGNYWRALQEAIELRKVIKSILNPFEALHDRPVLDLELHSDDRDGWQRKDHYYGLNGQSGRIELRPNVRTMDFQTAVGGY